MNWNDVLVAIGVFFRDHGFPMAAGFIGGLLAVTVRDQWRKKKEKDS